MATSKIQATKNYRLFKRHAEENRPLDLKKHRKLQDSMKKYGFLRCFPIVVRREPDDQLVVKDGQHRLMIAESLELPVYWVEETVDFDIAIINCTSKVWVLRDYAQKYAANGNKAYEEGLAFAEQHSLPVGTAFCLLAGTISFNNCQGAFIDGSFKVKDRDWANAVAGIYGPLTVMSPSIKGARFIEACMAVCRVKEFDAERLLSGAEKCRERLVSYSTRDAFLDMMESIYNYNRTKLVGLKSAAIMAMRTRNVVNSKASKPSRNGHAVAV